MTYMSNLQQFSQARLGLMVTLGLHSLLGRGEWVLNREQIPIDQYKALADQFLVPQFDAEELVRMAQAAGARYLVFITMHHDGFALYDSAANPFNSARHGCRRDLVAEVVEACRRHGLRIHLYHSLNQWMHCPDGVAALESESARKTFVDCAHERIRALVTRFNPIDCLWYDGWWPFGADGWRAEAMNAMVRSIQPHILFNGRNGLSGDFATPEQHLAAPRPWRPWEACITHNRNWGFYAGDQHWKGTDQVVSDLTQVAAGGGNLLLNVGPDGQGRIPEPSRRMLGELGEWLALNGAAIYGSEPLTMDLQQRGDHRGDWFHHGLITARGNTLFLHLLNWPGRSFTISGLESQVQGVTWVHSGKEVRWQQNGSRFVFEDLPEQPPHPLGGVLAVECNEPPVLYWTGGLRVPQVPHPRYDPCPSDLPH